METSRPEVVTREHVLEHLKKVEHPEIAVSVIDLGMILDVAVEDKTARVAIALPMLNIPAIVRDAIAENIAASIQELGLEMQAEYFQMTEEIKEQFFAAARANWKGSI